MHHYIHNLAEYRRFLKLQRREKGLQSLTILARRGSTWNLAGIKWVSALTIYDSDGPQGKIAHVIFPDLKLIAGDLDISSLSQGHVEIPRLEEIRGRLNDPSYEGCADFESVDSNCCLEVPLTCVVSDIDAVGSKIVTFYNIANDNDYTLRFELEEGVFVAGCREFDNIDKAIAHWKKRFEEHTGDLDEDDDYAHRALMFVFALTNFREEMVRGGLI